MNDGTPVETYVDPNGRVYARFQDSAREGDWKIQANFYCARWSDLGPEAWGCFNVFKNKNDFVLTRPNGTAFAKGKIASGNPLGLPKN